MGGSERGADAKMSAKVYYLPKTLMFDVVVVDEVVLSRR